MSSDLRKHFRDEGHAWQFCWSGERAKELLDGPKPQSTLKAKQRSQRRVMITKFKLRDGGRRQPSQRRHLSQRGLTSEMAESVPEPRPAKFP